MYRFFALVILMLSLASAAGPALSQTMYDEELSQLSGALRGLMVRAEQASPGNDSIRLAIQEELFELSKKLNRLEEEAARADLELFKRGNLPDRQLLLAASISKTLNLAASLVRSYLDTRDKIFWSSALSAAQLARTMQAAL